MKRPPSHRTPPLDDAKLLRLARQGVAPENLAERFGVARRTVLSSLARARQAEAAATEQGRA